MPYNKMKIRKKRGETMTLRHFRIFAAVCKEGGVTKAAKSLYLAQPAVSLAVRELEEHYGVRLFDRIGHRLYLTQAGKEFLRYTDRILALCDELETGARQWGDRSPLHIGSSMTIGTKLLPALVQDFRRRYPSVKVTVEIQNSGVIEEKLLENAMDFALIESAPHSGKLACRRFSGDRMVAVCSPKDPLAKEQGVTLAQLMTKPLLLREKGSGTRAYFKKQ